MHKYTVLVTHSAIQDAEDLALFYLEIAGEESADKFSTAVVEALETLADLPESNSYFDEENNLRRVRIKGHNVSIVYIIDNGVYEVIAIGVIHTASKPSKYMKNLNDRLSDLGNI